MIGKNTQNIQHALSTRSSDLVGSVIVGSVGVCSNAEITGRKVIEVTTRGEQSGTAKDEVLGRAEACLVDIKNSKRVSLISPRVCVEVPCGLWRGLG